MDELEMDVSAPDVVVVAAGDNPDGNGDGDGDDESITEECVPRIGEEYQVDIPNFVTRDFLGLGTALPMDEDEELFSTGLPVKVSVIQRFNERVSGGTSDLGDEATGLDEEGDSVVKNGKQKGRKKKRGGTRKPKPRVSTEQVVVPIEGFEVFNDDEVAAFALGLYLFGKNFNELKRFVETRAMKDLQQHYYGRFYGSAAYKRWFAARNNTSKRIVIGQQILIGWRQEELLRRIIKELNQALRPPLFEAIKAFNKGEMGFPDFVYRFRDVIGIDLFIDAVGLGCGKRDITMGSADSSVNNKKTDIPADKAFSEFTASEMSRAISGSSRLSKSRAQELFWEAVWPRLLAKGWSSEQNGAKGTLVYLIPGIAEYSKTSHTKGKDYFDSISEVLHHLSTNPSLLELPELDTELFSKSQPGMPPPAAAAAAKGSPMMGPGERRHKPTLWLSKGTHFSHKSEGSSSKTVRSPTMVRSSTTRDVTGEVKNPGTQVQTGGGHQLALGSTVAASSNQLGLGGTVVASGNPAGVVVSSGTYEHFGRKRSFYDAFPEATAGLQSGFSGVSLTSGRRVWLQDVLKQHLGNGKSMRLHGPMLTKVCPDKQTYGLYQLLVQHQEAKSEVFDLFLRLDSVGKLGFPLGQVQQSATPMTICIDDQSAIRMVEELSNDAPVATEGRETLREGHGFVEVIDLDQAEDVEAMQVAAAEDQRCSVPEGHGRP